MYSESLKFDRMIQIEAFKEDVWQAVWSHAKAIFVPMLIVGTMMTVILMGRLMAVVSSMSDSQFVRDFQEQVESMDPDSYEDILELQQWMMEYMQSADLGAIFGFFLLIYIVVLIISGYFLNAEMIISKDKILEGKTNAFSALGQAFNKNVFYVILLLIIVGLVSSIISNLIGMINPASFGLQFIASIISALITVRLLASIPARVFGGLNIMDSLKFSWKNITWKRSIYVVLVCIVGLIVFGLAMLLINLLISFTGAASGPLFVIFLLLGNAFASSLFIAMLAASFFRYADVEVVTGETVTVETEISLESTTIESTETPEEEARESDQDSEEDKPE